MCVLSWLLCYLVCNSLYECARWLLCNGLCSLNMHVGAVVCHVWICVFAAEVLEDTLNLVHKRTPRDTLHLVHTPHTLHIGWWSGHHMLHITCCTSHVAHCMLHMACCTWPVAHGVLAAHVKLEIKRPIQTRLTPPPGNTQFRTRPYVRCMCRGSRHMCVCESPSVSHSV